MVSLLPLVCVVATQSACDKFNTDGWEMVRHIAENDSSFFSMSDNATGVASSFGNATDDSRSWNVMFAHRDFNEYLFSTGDCEKYLIVDRKELSASTFRKEIRVKSTSIHSPPHVLTKTSSLIRLEEPMGTKRAGIYPQGGVLYAEKISTDGGDGELLRSNGGLSIRIRKSNHCKKFISNRWKIVRHLNPSDDTFYDVDDKAVGTAAAFGSPSSPPQLYDLSWGIPFAHASFTEYMFSTGDCQHYLIVGKESIWSNDEISIKSSSVSSHPYTISRLGSYPLSLKEYWPTAPQHSGVMYADSGLVATQGNSNYLRSHNGLSVWIRGK